MYINVYKIKLPLNQKNNKLSKVLHGGKNQSIKIHSKKFGAAIIMIIFNLTKKNPLVSSLTTTFPPHFRLNITLNCFSQLVNVSISNKRDES